MCIQIKLLLVFAIIPTTDKLGGIILYCGGRRVCLKNHGDSYSTTKIALRCLEDRTQDPDQWEAELETGYADA